MAAVFEDLSAAEQDARERLHAKKASKALLKQASKAPKASGAIEKALASDFVAASFDVGELAGKGGFSSALVAART